MGGGLWPVAHTFCTLSHHNSPPPCPALQYPVEHPEKFEKYGMAPSKGVLFYGPPGERGRCQGVLRLRTEPPSLVRVCSPADVLSGVARTSAAAQRLSLRCAPAPGRLRQDAAGQGHCQRMPGQLHLRQGAGAPDHVVWRVGGQRARDLRQGEWAARGPRCRAWPRRQCSCPVRTMPAAVAGPLQARRGPRPC